LAFAALSLFLGIVYPFERSDVHLVQDSISGPLWWVTSPDSAVRFSATFSALALLAGFLTMSIAAAAILIWLAVGYLRVVLLSP
jgi:hypothetical protein